MTTTNTNTPSAMLAIAREVGARLIGVPEVTDLKFTIDELAAYTRRVTAATKPTVSRNTSTLRDGYKLVKDVQS